MMSDTDSTLSDDLNVCLVRCPLPQVNSSAVHSLPCHIEYDGPASVHKYFHPQGTNTAEETGIDKATQTAQFRGVELCGQHVSLGSMSLTGGVVKEPFKVYERMHRDIVVVAGLVVDEKTTSDSQDLIIWDVDSHFDEFTFWNVKDELVDESLEVPGAMKGWSELSKAIHYRL